ncbi:MAG: peptidylprolyl isomerase, partial [Bacteroidales bacterium]|nr:peptidylprolyl isomerase [Bacteroidales bacterium]
DADMKERLVLEAYDHFGYDVHARHILFALSENAAPADTLKVYKLAMSVRDSILKGADFAEMAYRHSDEVVRRKKRGAALYTGREGDLGYFTSFGMVYPFEHAVYNMKVGEISKPVRTRFGYHIIQLLDKQKALGKVSIAHILVKETAADTTEGAKAAVKDKIDEAYDRLEQGDAFEATARYYSEDAATADKGGLLPEFTVSRMMPEVVKAIYGMEPGTYSKPIHTRLGWQILYLYNATGAETLETLRPEIEYRIRTNRDVRAELPLQSYAHKLMREYGIKENPEVLATFIKTLLTDDVLKGRWVYDSTNALYKKTLFVYDGKSVPLGDFARYVADRQRAANDGSKEMVIRKMYDLYKNAYAFKDEILKLDKKYPEFKELMDEYRDGIYLFEMMNERVWTKASVDTAGLEAFFEANKANYMWPKKADAVLVIYDVREAETDKVRKWITKAYASGKTDAALLQKEADKKFGAGAVRVEEGQYAPGESMFLDRIAWEEGVSNDILSGESLKAFAIIRGIIPEKQKKLAEVRGIVITDYQNYLDTMWVKELKERYPVLINEPLFRRLNGR